MALALHVIAHKLTDAVLAACTRGEGGTSDELVAELVGDKLTVTLVPKTPPAASTEITELGTFDAADLVVEKVPGDTDFTTGSVFDTPLSYVVTRDNQGAAQSIVLQSESTHSIDSSNNLTVVFSSQLPASGADGLVRLIKSNGTVIDQQVLFKPASATLLTTATVPLTAAAGTYTMVAFAKGYRPVIDSNLTLS